MGLHIAKFIPTSSTAYSELFDTDGIKKVTDKADHFDNLDLAKKFYVPVSWNNLFEMVFSLISLVQVLRKCIITMGYMWLLEKLKDFHHKINEKLSFNKLLLAKIIWWFEEKQLDFTRQIS